MFYRLTGSLPQSLADTRRLVPHRLDRWAIALGLVFAFVVLPLIGSQYIFDAILLPFLALSLAAVGLNLLTGLAGQVSLGSAAFLAVGAFAAYNFNLRLPGLPLPASFLLAGVTSAMVGLVFGLPSLRLKGFYLAVSTLAAQFFVQWTLTQFSWFSGGDTSGVITAPPIVIAGIDCDAPAGRYLVALGTVALLTWIAIRLSRSQIGRNWIAIRDMEIAASVIGVKVLPAKLLAFAISSFYCGVAGALWAFLYLRTVEPDGFDLHYSFEILFMIIIGGLGSIRGAFLGAGFLVVLPLVLSRASAALFGGAVDSGVLENLQKVIVGGLIIGFLLIEPAGLVALWKRLKRQIEAWPFTT